ncbi:MAG: hypothetical protein HYV07_33885, partial [Deltaproteobacteria bacterium]|nr:hypothetical protein [Deltaproteobacteria bacterium]
MSRLSKQVENRLSVTEKVIASARVHGPATTKSLVELAPGVAYETLFETLAATLGRAAQAMREAELSYTAEQADDVAPRDARDERTAELSKLMSLVRNSVENAVGASGLQTYGLLGPTPRLPAQLANRASNTINLLKSKSAKATDELGSLFSTEAIVAVLEPKVEALQAALKDLDREAREL